MRETRNVEKYEGRMVSKRKLERASLAFVLTICASRISEPELEKKQCKTMKATGNRTCIIALMKFVCILFMR